MSEMSKLQLEATNKVLREVLDNTKHALVDAHGNIDFPSDAFRLMVDNQIQEAEEALALKGEKRL